MKQQALRLSLVLFLMFSAVGFPPPQSKTETGIVELVVCDTYGRPLKSYAIEVRSEDNELFSPKKIHSSGSIALPYGAYVINGTASLHQYFSRRIIVQEPKMVVFVGFSLLDSGHAITVNTPLKGRVIARQNIERSTAIRAISIWGSFAKEGWISRDGSFELDEVPLGRYILLVLRGEKVLASTEFAKTMKQEEATIELVDSRRAQ